MQKDPDRNVVGGTLLPCSNEPVTGFFRDGCCSTGPEDLGSHTVCAVMTEEFLSFSLQTGNDLSTPRPEWGFPGLQPDDRWCVCASRCQTTSSPLGAISKYLFCAENEAHAHLPNKSPHVVLLLLAYPFCFT